MSTGRRRTTKRSASGGSLANTVPLIDPARLARGPTEDDLRAMPATTVDEWLNGIVMRPFRRIGSINPE
jgi:hypothetical protein